jgi:signal transduction histidine kinase
MAATTGPTSRPSRWPWIVLAVAASFAAIGLVFVSLNGVSLIGDITNFTAFMGMGIVGALSLSRAPDNRIGWLLLWVAVAVGAAFTTGEASIYAARHGWPAVEWLAWPGNALWAFSIFPLLIILPLVYPNGRLPSPRWRWILWTGIGISVLAFVSIGFADATFDVGALGREVRVPNPLHVPALGALAGAVNKVIWPMLLGLFVVAAGSMVVRFRRSSGVERQQLKWFAFAAVVLVAYFLISGILEAFGIPEGTWSEVVSGLAFLGIPVAVGISILQYRLWDLDVVVKKALVAGALVVLALAVYGGAVALFGVAAADRQSPGSLFVIALLLGIAFRPVMRIARRVVDRVVYGRRATPYEVLTEFSERVGTSYATEDVLPRMAQVLGEGAGAEVARVWLRAGRDLRQAAAWPEDATAIGAVPTTDEGVWSVPGETAVEVRDRGELLGAVSVRMPATEPMNPTKEKLVRDLAAQAGLVLRNVRLVEDLRASRQRLVAAQDEERRRLERNIHDGAQQQLVALAVKARLARQLTERDPAKTAEMLIQIETETQTALEDLRDLARGIYPPLLADRGLVAALEAQSRKAAVPVSVEADAVGRYSVDVEATVYFCALEALQNVAKYADADRTVIHLSQSNGSLSFEVVDEGRGFDPDTVATGSGLQGMADRLAAVGGSLEIRSAPGRGTTVAGRVPVTTV